jgi:hypothetical protein
MYICNSARRRAQYEGAMKKHRSQVQSYKGAPASYSGEGTGIKPTTIKSTKLGRR